MINYLGLAFSSVSAAFVKKESCLTSITPAHTFEDGMRSYVWVAQFKSKLPQFNSSLEATIPTVPLHPEPGWKTNMLPLESN